MWRAGAIEKPASRMTDHPREIRTGGLEMRREMIAIFSHLAEMGVFFAAAAALTVGALVLR